MLMLSILHGLLTQVLTPPTLHTAVLFTPSGELVSFASVPVRAKDEIRILVGISGEVWQETREQGYGMVDSELGRIIVLPVEEDPEERDSEQRAPLMLLALNAADKVDWEELNEKGRVLAKHIAKPLAQFRDLIVVSKPPPPATATTSPTVVRT